MCTKLCVGESKNHPNSCHAIHVMKQLSLGALVAVSVQCIAETSNSRPAMLLIRKSVTIDIHMMKGEYSFKIQAP